MHLFIERGFGFGPLRRFVLRALPLWAGFLVLSSTLCATADKRLQALRLFNERRFDECINLCKVALREDPLDYRMDEVLVQASEQKKSLPETIRYFERLSRDTPARLNAHYGLGLCYRATQDYPSAIASFHRCLALAPEFLPPYTQICEAYQAYGRLDLAISYLSDLSKKSRKHANAYLGLAKAYQLSSRPAEAIKYLDRFVRLNPRSIEAQELRKLVYRQTNNIKALKAAAAALEELADARRDFETVARNYYDLGTVYHSAHPGQAEAYYKKAIHMANEVQDLLAAAVAERNLGILYRRLERPWEGLTYIEDSLRLSRQVGRPSEEALSLLRMGEIYYELDDFSKAYECFDQALKTFQRLQDADRESYAQRNIGKIYMAYGDYDAAMVHFEKALAGVRNPSIKELVLLALGDAHRGKREYAPALARYQEALAITRSRPYKTYVDLALGNVGGTYFELGEVDKALAYLKAALRAARAANERRREGRWRKKIGDVMLKQGRRTQAEQWYVSALQIGRAYPAVASETYEALAAVRRDQGDDRKALDYYERAIDAVDNIKSDLLERERDAFFEPKLPLYENTVDLLIGMSQRSRDPGYLRRAFYHVQQIKSQSLLESLLQGPSLDGQLRRVSDDKSYREFLEIQKDLKERYRDLMKVLNDDPGVEAKEKVAGLETAIDRLRKERQRWIRQRVPHYDKLSHPEIRTVEHIQSLLKPKETLLVYFVGEEKTFVFVLSKDAFYCAALAGQGRAVLRRQLCAISPLFCDPRREGDALHMNERWANVQLDELHQLYFKIFKPLEKHIGTTGELIIIPDDVLYRLPFEMLVTEFKDLEKPVYLLRRYPIAYAYSPSLLNARPYRGNHWRTTRKGKSVFIGDPDFRNYHMSRNGWSDRYADLSLITRSDTFVRLPFAEREVRGVAKYDRNSVVYTGSLATEKAFKSNAESAEVLHISTHYILDPLNPLHSKMVFALNPHIDQQGEDGFLYPYEILGLQLDAQLVALTGCQTGGGRLRPGEGIEGLARTFLYAGARSLLVSLWPVTDGEATVELTTRFYQYLVQGLSKSRALQQAKLDLIEREYGSFYWAPFVLIGDNGTVASAASRFTGPIWLAYVAVALTLLITVSLYAWRQRYVRH